jgi:YesN/AraC family two-component response regulator
MKTSFKCLLVDDQPFVRSILKEMLFQMGYFSTIEEAVDGQDAWEILQQEYFDLIICDVDMPRLNGIELLKRCYEADSMNTAFIIITGFPSEEVVQAALASGAKSLLGKPFSFSLLKENVESILGLNDRSDRSEKEELQYIPMETAMCPG